MRKSEASVKVNLHICEGCNYKCRHCFAKFDCRKTLGLSAWKRIVDNVLAKGTVNAINLAGGEPLLYPRLHELAAYIRSKGVKLSLITNGSMMTDEWISKNAALYETIGFSIDTLDPVLQIEAGRADIRGNVVSPDDFTRKIKLLRKYNPDIRIKVNTVVTSINKNDYIAEYIKEWKVDRWKILKMQYFEDGTHCNGDIMIDDNEYFEYVENALRGRKVRFMPGSSRIYSCDGTEVVVEGNISGSYIMIDANGCLVDDRNTTSYVKIANCLTDDFTEALEKLNLDQDLYSSRYGDNEKELQEQFEV